MTEFAELCGRNAQRAPGIERNPRFVLPGSVHGGGGILVNEAL